MSSRAATEGCGAGRLPGLWAAPGVAEPAAAQEGAGGGPAVQPSRLPLSWQRVTVAALRCRGRVPPARSGISCGLPSGRSCARCHRPALWFCFVSGCCCPVRRGQGLWELAGCVYILSNIHDKCLFPLFLPLSLPVPIFCWDCTNDSGFSCKALLVSGFGLIQSRHSATATRGFILPFLTYGSNFAQFEVQLAFLAGAVVCCRWDPRLS